MDVGHAHVISCSFVILVVADGGCGHTRGTMNIIQKILGFSTNMEEDPRRLVSWCAAQVVDIVPTDAGTELVASSGTEVLESAEVWSG